MRLPQGPRGALGVGLDLVPLTLTAGQAPPPGRVALLSPQPWWAADSEAPMGPVPYFRFVLSEQLQCRRAGGWDQPLARKCPCHWGTISGSRLDAAQV